VKQCEQVWDSCFEAAESGLRFGGGDLSARGGCAKTPRARLGARELSILSTYFR
jgi:hypothetical protein